MLDGCELCCHWQVWIVPYLNHTLQGIKSKFYVGHKCPDEITIVLSLAGVDSAISKSHSTRAAATLAASVKFVPVSDIIKQAG